MKRLFIAAVAATALSTGAFAQSYLYAPDPGAEDWHNQYYRWLHMQDMEADMQRMQDKQYELEMMGAYNYSQSQRIR